MIRHVLFDRELPRGWSVTTVDAIKANEKSSCVAGPFGSNISSKYFVADGVPVIRGGNLTDDLTRFVPTDFAFVSHERAASYRPQHVRAGDLVFTCWGTIGQVGLIPGDGPYPEYIISNKQLKFRPNVEVADPLYLFYYFASPQMVTRIRSRAIGAAVPGINLGILKELEVVLPPLHIQRRIVSVLSAYDDLIHNNTRRIALLEEMTRRIYEEWFVRLRFPGHDNVRMVKSELGEVPESWAHVSLSNLAEVNARTIKRGKEPEEITYIDISSVSTASINQQQRMHFVDAPGRARRIVQDGDVIWACVRPNRKSYAAIIDPDPSLIVSTGFAVLSATTVPWPYLYQAVTTEDFVGYLVNHAKGAAYPAVSSEDFENANVLRPDAATLQLFNAKVEPMMRLNAMLARKNKILRTTRDLLLPRLISGELDVSSLPQPEAAVA